MKRSRILPLLALVLALVAAPSFAALQGVQITSQIQGTLTGVGAVNITLTGSAAHSQSGTTVTFVVKQISATSSPLGAISASLDSTRPSVGTLSSTTFPAVHRQNFYLLIKTSTMGTLVSDSPLTLTATIQSSPPTATYVSVPGNVVFYRQGDPSKLPVLTVQSVTSNVTPASTQTVNISSVVTANVGGTTSTLQLNGSASDILSGQNVLFIFKDIGASTGPLGTTTVTLDPRQPSTGTLASSTFPTTHTQNFFLQIQSQNLGTMVADGPVTLNGTVQSCPPHATYTKIGSPVPFYRQGDPSKQTILTIMNVVSTVTP